MLNFGAEFLEASSTPVHGGRQYILINGHYYVVTATDEWGNPLDWRY